LFCGFWWGLRSLGLGSVCSVVSPAEGLGFKDCWESNNYCRQLEGGDERVWNCGE